MKKIISILAIMMLTTAAFAQTLNVQTGNVTYQYPASQVGYMTYSNGTTITILNKTFELSDISSMTVDNTAVTDNTVGVTYNGTTASVTIAGNIARYITATIR